MSQVPNMPASMMRSIETPSRPLGSLPDSDLYIERPADAELLCALQAGENAHVVAARQSGKTRLLRRAAYTLTAQGYRCIKLDMGAFSYENTAAQWFRSLAREIALGLGLRPGWSEILLGSPSGQPASERFACFLRETLRWTAAPVVLFLDEVESFGRMPHSVAASFLATIHSSASDCAATPLQHRLRFCFAGACSLAELPQDVQHTAFPIAREIPLEDFDWPSVRTCFLPRFAEAADQAEAVLARIYHWTQGHPYLTHRLCETVLERVLVKGALTRGAVDHAAREMFLEPMNRGQEGFADIERRLLSGSPRRALRRLALYARLLQGCQIRARSGDRVQMELRLTGLVKLVSGEPHCLAVRSPIFAAVFDMKWLHEAIAHRVTRLPGSPNRLRADVDRSRSKRGVLSGAALR